MSSSRRRLERRSLSSPLWSMADSLSICGGREGAAHLVRPIEVEPVARALQDLQLVLTFNVSAGVLGAAPAERGILIAPQQDGGRRNRADVRESLPRRPDGGEGGAVISGGRRQASGASERSCEMLDHRPRHHLWIGADGPGQPQAAVIVLRQHSLGLALQKEEPDVARASLLVLVVFACVRQRRP